MSSFGDFIALSDVCDASTARIIQREVSDGVIAPGYDADALEILKSKRKGTYNIIKIDPNYTPAPIERKQVYGITFEQGRNELVINDALFANREIHAVQLGCLRVGRTGNRYRRGTAVAYPLHTSCRSESG